MSYILNKQLKTEIPKEDSFKLAMKGQMELQNTETKICHFKDNKPYEQKVHQAMVIASQLVYE